MGDAATGAIAKPRLGGILGILFWIAVLIVTAVVCIGVANIYLGGIAGLVWGVRDMVSRAIAAESTADLALRVVLIPMTLLFIWAACMVAFTLARSRMGPAIISAAFALWVLGTTFASRTVYAGSGDFLIELVGLLPRLVTDAIIILAFAGYMFDGARPKRIYGAGAS